MRIFKFAVRIVGLFICMRDFYLVLTEHQLVMFSSVVVTDWTMYILPFSAPFIAEWCIIASSVAKKEIEKQRKA